MSLEAELGVRLLNRTTRAVSPTEAGQAYYDRLRPLLEEFDTLDLAIRNTSQAFQSGNNPAVLEAAELSVIWSQPCTGSGTERRGCQRPPR